MKLIQNEVDKRLINDWEIWEYELSINDKFRFLWSFLRLSVRTVKLRFSVYLRDCSKMVIRTTFRQFHKSDIWCRNENKN